MNLLQQLKISKGTTLTLQIAAAVVPPPSPPGENGGPNDVFLTSKNDPGAPVGTGRPKARVRLPDPGVTDWPAHFESIRNRRSMRQVQHHQRWLWMDICEGICAPFTTADDPTKERILWELLTAPKRFLYFPQEKLAHAA